MGERYGVTDTEKVSGFVAAWDKEKMQINIERHTVQGIIILCFITYPTSVLLAVSLNPSRCRQKCLRGVSHWQTFSGLLQLSK